MMNTLIVVCLLVSQAWAHLSTVGDQDKAGSADSLLPSLLQASRFNLLRVQQPQQQQSQEQQPREDYYDQAREEDRQQQQQGFRGVLMPGEHFQGGAMRFVAPSLSNQGGQIFLVEGDAYDDGTVVRGQEPSTNTQWPAIVRPVVEPAIPRPVLVDSSTEQEEKRLPHGTASETATEATTEAVGRTETLAPSEEVFLSESTIDQSVGTTEKPKQSTEGDKEEKIEEEVTEAPKEEQTATEESPKEVSEKEEPTEEPKEEAKETPKETTEQSKVEEATEEPKEVTDESKTESEDEPKEEAKEVTEEPKEKSKEVKEVTEEPKEEEKQTEQPKEETTQSPMDAVESEELPKEGESTVTFETPKEEDVVLIDSPTKPKESSANSKEEEPLAEEILTTETPEVETEPLRMPKIAGRFSRA